MKTAAAVVLGSAVALAAPAVAYAQDEGFDCNNLEVPGPDGSNTIIAPGHGTGRIAVGEAAAAATMEAQHSDQYVKARVCWEFENNPGKNVMMIQPAPPVASAAR